MPEILHAIRLPGLRLDSLGNYLATLGLMRACSRNWSDFRGLWGDEEFIVGAAGLTSADLVRFLLKEWKPVNYERWWKGSKEIAKLRSWEPSLARVKLLDAHIVAKGSNVYNDILGTGGNVGKRDFAKVSEVCRDLISKPASEAWLNYSLFGGFVDQESSVVLPDLPSTGTWFANANKAFNSGYRIAREGQLSPWSFLLALEGAVLLRGGSGKRLSARATRYATFPFMSDAAAPATAGELESERSEFWAPVWNKPATFVELRALLQRGQARVGKRAARAPFDFAAAARTSGTQAGLVRFERFGLRQTTSANTYEAIHAGSAVVAAGASPSNAMVRVANWVESLPKDKSSTQQSMFYGLRAPVERAMLSLAQSQEPERWRELLLAIGRTQRRVDQNQDWRASSQVLSQIPQDLFREAWPELTPELEFARAVSSLTPPDYGLRHNIFGLSRSAKMQHGWFADPRPASAVWHDGDPVALLADLLERRLVDAESTGGRAPVPPLRGRQFCPPTVLDQFLRGQIDTAEVAALLPVLSLIKWRRSDGQNRPESVPGSAEFLMQAYFRPLLTPRLIRLKKGTDVIKPDAVRARALVKMIRGEMWRQAFALGERVYRSCGIDVVSPPGNLALQGDLIAAALLAPVELVVTREAFRRWMVKTKKGRQ
jgi:CRISPR-associated protein Csx17